MLSIVHHLVLMSFFVGSDFINLSKAALAFIFSDIYLLCEIGTPFYWVSLVCEV